MTNLDITNIGTWVQDNKETVYRLWVKKHIFTPYEQDKRFVDQSIYNDSYAEFVRITNAIEIPNDVLLEVELLEGKDSHNSMGIKHYYKLSDIHFSNYEYDQFHNNEYGEEII